MVMIWIVEKSTIKPNPLVFDSEWFRIIRGSADSIGIIVHPNKAGTIGANGVAIDRAKWIEEERNEASRVKKKYEEQKNVAIQFIIKPSLICS